MALKTLMLRRSIDKKKAELEALRAKDAEFQTREAELEKAITETETPEQEQAVTDEVNKFDADQKAHEDAKAQLAGEIESLEADLSAAEAAAPTPAADPATSQKPMNHQERGKPMININIRSLPMGQRVFDALPMDQRSAIVQREDVKQFLTRLRAMKGQTRDVVGGELNIPVVFLDLIVENQYRYSKLMNRVRVRPVRGEARQNIAGTVPEAVWTEMCGAINELTFAFNQVVVDGYKVAGYIPVCNSLLDDSDVGLAGTIVEMISESLGLAKDKAILYGKGAASKMPLGIVPRLAQTSQPAGYPTTAPAWVDLHTSNIIKINSADEPVAFWASLALAVGNTYNRYARGTQFWAMNSKTLATLKSKLITFAASGVLLARFNGVMPIVEGDVDVLEFMPDGDIVGGYGDLYLLAERSGMTIESSREVQFIQDNTVFKGKERCDGQPVIANAFVAININNQAVTTSMTFAADTANDALLQSLSVGTESLAPGFDATVQSYTIATASNASDKIEATPAVAGAKVAINYNGSNVRNGGTVTWAADNTPHPLTITVTNGNAVRVYTVMVTKAS